MKLDLVLERARGGRSRSPPPERAALHDTLHKHRKHRDKWEWVAPRVEAAPPRLPRPLAPAPSAALALLRDNMRLLSLVRDAQLNGGRVECWRGAARGGGQQHVRTRSAFAAAVRRDNRRLHRLFTTASCRVTPTAALERWWAAARRERERRARGPWLLAPPGPRRDPAFDAPPAVQRPRVRLQLGLRGGAALGALRLELFAETCPRTAALFLALLAARRGYVGTRFYRAIEQLCGAGGGGARHRLVRVCDAAALPDLLTLAQAQLQPQEELLLVEVCGAGGGAAVGGVRGAAPGAVAAATAALPPPRRAPRQPDLQALLATNDMDHDLRKILIRLVEAGARLAAAGPRPERALAQLRAALAPPRAPAPAVQEVITPEEIARRVAAEAEEPAPALAEPAASDVFRRAQLLRRFLEEFRSWRESRSEAPRPEAVAALRALGYGAEAAAAALARVGGAPPAAAAWLAGERGASVCELRDGLPPGHLLRQLLRQPQIQRGLLNTRMVAAFVGVVGRASSAALWRASPRGSPLLAHISRTYHAEKYCLAVNQFSEQNEPASSRQKVPGLYWSGGDVVRDCGLGRPVIPPLVAALGLQEPENFHYPHSAPGLVTMHVDADGEVCGTFSITFKPLPQLDLRSVVFGRVLFPSRTYEAMRSLGCALSSQPVVEIRAATTNTS